jgi:hypothetical protein
MDEISSKSHDYLDELLAKSSEFARTVAEEIGKLPTGTERRKVVLLLLASALTHYRAINFLLDDGRYIASALALVRSVADASFRAIWIARLATDDEFSAAWNSDDPKKWPNPRKVTELLQAEFNQVLLTNSTESSKIGGICLDSFTLGLLNYEVSRDITHKAIPTQSR